MSKGFWIGAIVLAAVVLWGVGYVVNAPSGDTEFQKMMEATEQVKSFRGMFVGTTPSTQHSERLWEVDCNRRIVHKQSQELPIGANPVETKEDVVLVGSDQKYTHNSDGSWEPGKYESTLYSASWYCDNLAQGTIRDLLPDFRAMLRSATFARGDKKTVNGVRCRDWNFTMHSRNSGQKGTVCIGTADHLPYEMTVDNGDHYSYSDYNRPMQFDVPDAVLQPASSTGAPN